MGVKNRKYVRRRDTYDPTVFDQEAVEPDEIPDDAPTHCSTCGDELTPLRRLSGRPFCTKEACLLAARMAKTETWRLIDLHKQGETVVILGVDGDTVNTSKRGAL